MTFEAKHGRPKPPKICVVMERHYYEIAHPHVLTIFKDRKSSLWAVCIKGHESHVFRTHAEAVAYAHTLTQERSQE